MKIERPLWLKVLWIVFFVAVTVLAGLYVAFFAGYLPGAALIAVSSLGVLIIIVGGIEQWRTNVFISRVHAQALAAGGNLCPACQYPMPVAVGEVCPECGTKIDEALLFQWQLWWRSPGQRKK